MRPDMAKVIVERPRVYGYPRSKPSGYRRKLQRDLEAMPAHEGMRARWRLNPKWLNEHLGPLRRYLNSQVGRPWNEVFSEICAHVDRSSAVQDHVRDHVKEYVCEHVTLVAGVPHSAEGNWRHGKPLATSGPALFYVCPASGLLRRVERAPRRRPVHRKQPEVRHVQVSPSLQCRLVGGAWHLVTLAPLPPEGKHSEGRDVLLNRPASAITREEALKQYGRAVYAAAARRLARRELRQYPVPVEEWR